jgi:hypothetical protein
LQGDYTGEYVSIGQEGDDRIRFPADVTFLATKR